MLLDIDFIISSGLLIACLLPLYIYRKKIFTRYKSGGTFHLFVKDLKLHMTQHHPKIKIDYSIIDKTENEKNTKLRETLIVENVVQQFFEYPYKKNTQEAIPKEKLWINYMEKSTSNPKYPSDWPQRKELAWKRDNNCCNRCGDKIALNNSFSIFVKDIKDGGGYNFENIIILCSDCNKILNSTNVKNTISSLNLNDRLILFIEK
ncbi:MAG: HNH endonuclease [Aliarcobacter sp.]|nr:HNH endonuclease [Aliarcobacter sp.]